MLVPESFGERLALVWLMSLVQLVQIGLGVCFALVALLSDFIPEFGHFFPLDVVLGSFA